MLRVLGVALVVVLKFITKAVNVITMTLYSTSISVNSLSLIKTKLTLVSYINVFYKF